MRECVACWINEEKQQQQQKKNEKKRKREKTRHNKRENRCGKIGTSTITAADTKKKKNKYDDDNNDDGDEETKSIRGGRSFGEQVKRCIKALELRVSRRHICSTISPRAKSKIQHVHNNHEIKTRIHVMSKNEKDCFMINYILPRSYDEYPYFFPLVFFLSLSVPWQIREIEKCIFVDCCYWCKDIYIQ